MLPSICDTAGRQSSALITTSSGCTFEACPRIGRSPYLGREGTAVSYQHCRFAGPRLLYARNAWPHSRFELKRLRAITPLSLQSADVLRRDEIFQTVDLCTSKGRLTEMLLKKVQAFVGLTAVDRLFRRRVPRQRLANVPPGGAGRLSTQQPFPILPCNPG